ncbi:MAG: hypothetical protein A3H07_04130 [Candidatus Jacksonbacteria bacterium RIFCSPLOWO2_12_FULL_44_15b]|nr:MAG: hypothetical protein A3H07_04130 [Candidatus Jacksonbacteria bacterium RIFCSPLOWO2_12_FULL_44_15b]
MFVDVQNMYYSAKNLFDRHVNFGALLKESVSERKLIRATAYTVKAQIPEEGSFFEALRGQGFEVKSKELQIFPGGVKKGDWDVGIAIDAIKLLSQLNVVVLVTGDGDFLPLVEYLQYHGLLVELVAFKRTTSAKLLEKVDAFIDLEENARKFLMPKAASSAFRRRAERDDQGRRTSRRAQE